MGITKLTIKNGIIQDKYIDGIPVVVDIVVPKGKRNVRTLIAMKECIGPTNHNTGNSAPTATASAHSNWLQNVENADKLYVSPHIFVDQHQFRQVIPLNEVGYHAGDGNGAGNFKTIGIEICQNANILIAEENAKKLNAALILTYPHFKVFKHQDWSGKYCPAVILSSGRWAKFVRDIDDYVKGATVKPAPAPRGVINGDTVTIGVGIYGYKTAADALAGKNPVKMVPSGKYPVMIRHSSGAWNIGKGYLYWINPKKLPSTVSATVIHIVKPGEVVSKLAVKYDTTVENIKNLNKLKDVNKIFVGQQLRVK